MEFSYDKNAPKKATNLTVNSELLVTAKGMRINLSATLEQALLEVVRQKRREQWRQENKSAVEDYNAKVEEAGVFSDSLRGF